MKRVHFMRSICHLQALMVCLISFAELQFMNIRLWTRLSNAIWPYGGAFASKLIGGLNCCSWGDIAIRLDIHLWSLSWPHSASRFIHRGRRMVFRNQLLLRICNGHIWFRIFNAIWFLEPFVENVLRTWLMQHMTAKWEVLVLFVDIILHLRYLVVLVHESVTFLIQNFSRSRILYFMKPRWVPFWFSFLKILIHIAGFRIEVVTWIHDWGGLFRHQLHLLGWIQAFDGIVTVLLGHPVKSVLKGHDNFLSLVFYLFLVHKFGAFRNLIINILDMLNRLSTRTSIKRNLLGSLTLAKRLIFTRSVL